MIAEAVERAASRALADVHAVLALVEKRARLLAVPRRGDESHPMLDHFHCLWNAAGEQLHGRRQSFPRPQCDVVACENSVWVHQTLERTDDLLAECLEARTHELHDEPTVVAIADQRWTSVCLTVNDAVRIRLDGERQTDVHR